MKKIFVYLFHIYVLILFSEMLFAQHNENHFNSFSEFENYFSPGNDSTLPVTLIYFEGIVYGNKILLRWGTATEINNYGFDIERTKLNPFSWQTIGFEFGHGNSNSPKHYIFWDSTVVDTAIYVYRLKQINNDGSFEYSDTIHVNFHLTNIEDIDLNLMVGQMELSQNFPNPFNPLTYISFRISEPDFYSINIFDITGKQIANLFDDYLSQGSYSFIFKPSTELSSGVYIYQLNSRSHYISKKMTYLK